METLNKIAQPFPKPVQGTAMSSLGVTKGKEKASQASIYNPCDLVSLVKEPKATAAKADVASVHLSYYDQPAATGASTRAAATSATCYTPPLSVYSAWY